MSIILAILFFGIVILIGFLINRKTVPVAEKKLSEKNVFVPKGIFTHPGHAWVEVVEPDVVSVGMDRFTKSVFGSIDNIKIPQSGEVIHQGGRAWTLEKNQRQLSQISPISGKVVEVNKSILDNPRTLNEENTEKNWILKIKPDKLKRELRNLLYGDMTTRWNQLTKERLVSILVPAGFPVLQDGGDISPNLGNELPNQQWEKVAKEFFNQI